MNKQDRNSSSGIEWTEYTWNPIGGCKHACRWTMPDGSTAICYAEEIANGVAKRTYPGGFEQHYWREHMLNEPLELRQPAKIFVGSMADVFGSWVPDEHIARVLDTIRAAKQHTFQALTKNAPRLRQFADQLPPNLWVGVSVPPSIFKGKTLSADQQTRMLNGTLKVLSEIPVPVRWLSIEPLSFDVSPILAQYPGAIQWAVIGAASNGKRKYQPEKVWVEKALAVLDEQKVAVFFKGNLEWEVWREAFPTLAPASPVEVATPNKPAPIDLETIEAALESLRQKEAVIRADYWEKYMALKAPIDERMARLMAGRKSGRVHERVEKAYHKAVEKRRNEAFVVLWRLRPLTNEAAKLRTRRANLLYQARKSA